MCPILEYARPVWHTGLTQKHIDHVERIQMRAMKIAYSNLDYISAINECNIPTLEMQSVLVPKCVHGDAGQ